MKCDKLAFPNVVTMKTELTPTEEFAPHSSRGKTMVPGEPISFVFDANFGRMSVEGSKGIEPVAVDYTVGDVEFRLRGAQLTATTMCRSYEEFREKLNVFYHVVPLFFYNFSNAITCGRVEGDIGGEPFLWEVEGTAFYPRAISKASQEELVVKALFRLPMVAGDENRRLLGALYYYHVARRLSDAGRGPHEFMAEIILNLAKVLEILFGPTRDEIRRQLLLLGFEARIIEERYVPVMILRNELDVGHPLSSALGEPELLIIHRYLAHSLQDFRSLLNEIFVARQQGKFPLKPSDSTSSPDKKRIVARLLQTMESRLKREVVAGRSGVSRGA